MVFIADPALYPKCTIILGTWLASTAFVDVLLAIYLSSTLYKSRTGLARYITSPNLFPSTSDELGIIRTDDLLDRFISFTVNTAVLTAGLALADLGTFYALGNTNLIHWAINLTISKSFVNTLLASCVYFFCRPCAHYIE